jgi:hypothetical protein
LGPEAHPEDEETKQEIVPEDEESHELSDASKLGEGN